MNAWRVLLTRPAEESRPLAATLAEVGIYSSSLPLLEIEPCRSRSSSRSFDLGRYCAVIVVSKPAARLGWQCWTSLAAAADAVVQRRCRNRAYWPITACTCHYPRSG